jgi:hypothetical protein
MVLANLKSVLLLQLNHVHRTRDVVIRNDAKLRNDADKDILDDDTYLDQGFTRPKVYHIKNVEILSSNLDCINRFSSCFVQCCFICFFVMCVCEKKKVIYARWIGL